MSIPKSRGNVVVNKKKIDKAVKKRQKRLSPEERALFAQRRRLLEGSLITQSDVFEGAMVVQHIRGSQYMVRLSTGEEVYASHKRGQDRALDNSHDVTFSHGGWVMWK